MKSPTGMEQLGTRLVLALGSVPPQVRARVKPQSSLQFKLQDLRWGQLR